MIKRTPASVWEVIRKHRKAFLAGTVFPSTLGLSPAEAVMAVQFNALQAILGGMAFLTVEALGVWLVDFPPSVIAGCIIDRKAGASEPVYGALAGASFRRCLSFLLPLRGSLYAGLRRSLMSLG